MYDEFYKKIVSINSVEAVVEINNKNAGTLPPLIDSPLCPLRDGGR